MLPANALQMASATLGIVVMPHFYREPHVEMITKVWNIRSSVMLEGQCALCFSTWNI